MAITLQNGSILFKSAKKIYTFVKITIMKTQEILVAHPSTEEQLESLKAFLKALKIKFEVTKDTPYNPDFVAKIEKSRQDYKDGNYITLEQKDLKKYLGLE